MTDGVSQPRSSRTEDAYGAIKRRIITLDIPPGGTFTEGKLAADLGLSKTPVREALSRLEREGLVQITARSGYCATPVTIKDARDLMALRALLEADAAAQAAARGANAELLARLDELCRISYDPNDARTIERFLRANTEFHTTVARAGGNDRVAAVLEQVLHQLERLFHLGLAFTARKSEMVHEHRGLLEAIVARDPAAAREVALDQAHASERMILDALLSSPSVLEAHVSITAPEANPTGLVSSRPRTADVVTRSATRAGRRATRPARGVSADAS